MQSIKEKIVPGKELFFMGFPVLINSGNWDSTTFLFRVNLGEVGPVMKLGFFYACFMLVFVTSAMAQPANDYVPSETVMASLETVVQTYKAVGTVKPKSETSIESEVRAQVKAVHVQAGDRVEKGDLLVSLDDRQAASRLDGARASLNSAIANRQQAIQGVTAAEAAFNEAKLQYERIRGYYSSNAATKQELEGAESSFIQAKAALKRSQEALAAADSGIRQAREFVAEVKVGADFSRVISPVTGEVIRCMVEPGDLAMPGKPLVALRTESGFRMEAHVREGLIHKVRPGMILKAEITTLGLTCDAEIEEIIPYADPETRSFLVKALLPVMDGLYPGMYGKLLIPDGDREVVLLPMKAVIHTGQLELVMVKLKDSWQLRYIKTGKHSGDMVEVLSGLAGDETVGVGGLN
ncbi:Efflux transporter, RND family, MFP subunit [Desulfamplus magnetovallimortis]|uniref:Efflux transporter, RND family, MFP subunit n=1 Tax=Desulfamplus magnetovallimortis TaxID=1246637 RepID=A0A1W1H839_9BACT|nr:efflux RND transporter periplasmic adaptor subunit [Desulfamplus magnetovallimortis]SLM28650.1 Efflux transporter, RND family, MFP subunit [Desulfamplus magnetovallimortis]